jgi:hypothetical protein
MIKLRHIIKTAKRLYRQSIDLIELRKEVEKELHQAKRRDSIKEEHFALGKLSMIDTLLGYERTQG